MSGYSRDEAIGKNIAELGLWFFPEQRDEIIKAIKADGFVENINVMFKNKNGTLIQTLVSSCIITIDKEEYLLSVVRDISDQKKYEQEIIAAKEKAEESEEKFKAAFFTSPDSISITRRSGEYIEINEGFTRSTGYTIADVIGRTDIELNFWHIPEHRKLVEEMLINGGRGDGIVENLESVMMIKDGSLLPVLFSARYFSFNNEKYVLAVTRVISDWKKYEAEMLQAKLDAEESEARYKALHNASFGGLTIHDKGIILDCNQGLSEITGYSYDELIGMNGLQLISEGSREIVMQHILEGYEKPYEAVGLHKDGREFFVRLSGRNIPHKGKMVRATEFRDISQAKQAEMELIKSEEKYKALVDNAFEGIIITNLQGDILFVNRAVAKMLEVENVEDLVSRNVLEFVALESQPAALNDFQNVAQGNDSYIAEYLGVTAKGNEVWLESIGKLINYNDSLADIISVRDISQKKYAERELIKAKEKAEDSDRLKSAFLANMSHEIRTPMNGIIGFMNLLKEPDLTDEDKNDYINIVNISGQRLLDTMNDIIEISNIESGQLSCNYAETNINELLHFYIDFFDLQAKAKGIDLFLANKLDEANSIVLIDKHKLDGIITNLVKNAIKFTNIGFIEIGCSVQETQLLFYVKDSGIGVPSDRIDIIFDRFVQADMNITRPHEGSGLGLSIVKAYLDMLGGKIWVESDLGKGSTFYFTIPFMPAKKIVKIEKNIVEENNSSNCNILIAEDDDTSFKYLFNLLKKEGYQIMRACNGLEAVDAVKKNCCISIILMDIKMPLLNGFDACQEIRKFNPNIPIIAQSAYALFGDKEKAIEAGCDDYITKPIDKAILISMIQKYANGC